MENTTLKYTATCRLTKSDGTPCGFSVVDNPLNVAIIGQPDARIQNYIGALVKHLNKKHPEAFAMLTAQSQFFFAFLALNMYETPDPALLESKAKFVLSLRTMIAPPAISDENIEQAVTEMKVPPEDSLRNDIVFALRHMRDYYQGPSPKPAETPDSPLITP